MVKRKVPFASLEEKENKVAKLSAFGFKTVAVRSSDPKIDDPILNSDVLQQCRTPSKGTRKFLPTWKCNRPWLRYESTENLMFCDICINAFVTNTFTDGCSILKKECITKHEKATDENSHAAALSMRRQTQDMQKACDKAISKSKSAVLAAFRNVQFAADNNLANSIVPKLNDLCVKQGASQLLDLRVDGHTNYEHHSSICEFQEAMASVVHDNLIGRIQKSGVFSVMLDESTDISIHQNMVVYVRFLDNVFGRSEPVTRFLGIRQLSSATADSITSELLDLLKEKGLDIANLVGVATDGAAVMVGCRKGVVTQLRQICPGLLGTHCIAHRLALASGSAADSIRYLVKFQEILNNMFKYFDNSPKNMSRLEAIQTIMNDMKGSRLKQVFHTRWLSFSGSVQSVVDNYSHIVSVLLEDNSAKSLSMHKAITCYKFLYVLHFLADALKQLSILCKAYQRSNIMFTDVNPLMKSTVSVLCDLKEKKFGQNITRFLSKVPKEPVFDGPELYTFNFCGHTIRDSDSQRKEAVSACDSFISNVVKELQNRFTDEGDSATIAAITKVFDPSQCVAGCSDADADHMVDYLVRCELGDDVDCRQELMAFTAFVKAKVESSAALVTSTKELAQLATISRDTFPLVAATAERLLVMPVSTVDCERGFSKQNLIKTDLRNKLNIRNLENLMAISLTDEPIDLEESFQKWAAIKQRRALMPKH